MKTGRLIIAVAALACAGAARAQDAGGGAAPAAAATPLAAAAAGRGPSARRPGRPAPAGAGLRAMGDEEMRGVTAKGYAAMVFSQARLRPAQGAGAGDLERFLNPLLGLLSAEVLAQDVLYGPGGALPVWNRDGSVTLALPEWVGGIEVRHIRAGAADAGSFGSVRVNAIDLGRTAITLSPK